MANDQAPIDEGPRPEPRGRAGRGFFAKLGLAVLGGAIAWMAAAALVIWWQPGWILQGAVVAVALVAALLIPRRHVDRILSAFAVLLLIAAIFYLPSVLLTREVEFTIRATDRDSKAEAYLIHTDFGAERATDTGEAFHNRDAPLLGKMNSSDVQGQAASLVGQRVRARVFGFRIPMFSRYRNVIEIEEVEPQQTE